MKKIVLLAFLGMTILSFGQKKEKIKGNKEVLIKKFLLPDFKHVKVGEKFEVELRKATDTTRVTIETDDNLFEVIHFQVENETLSFFTTQEIVKKKRLKITVYVPAYLKSIEVLEKGKVFNEQSLDFKELEIQAFDRGKTDLILDIKEYLKISASNKSHVKLDATATQTEIIFNDYAQANIKASFPQLSLLLNDHSSFNIKGDSQNSEINVNNKAEFEGESFPIDNALVIAKDKSNTYVNAKKKLDLMAKGNAEVFIYNQPKINLKAFEDNAILYKK
jgi:hypothetical protein